MMNWRLGVLGTAFTVFLTIGGMVIDAAAQSSDVKSYSSSMCVSNNGNMYYSSGGAAYLSGSGYGTILCPAVKDRYGSSYSQSGRMRVLDQSSSDDMVCYMMQIGRAHV